MSRLRGVLLLDVRVQARSKLYHIGVVVAVLIGVAARLLFPVDAMGRALAAFYLVALGGTTYMFGASMVLLEKSEQTVVALRTTPLTSREYILSKAISLTSFAVLEGALVFAIAGRQLPTSFLPLVAGVLVLGVSYTFLGIGQVAGVSSVTKFLFPGALVVSLVFQLPFLYVLGVGPSFIWYLVPTQGPLLLMLGGFEQLTPLQWSYATVTSAACLTGSYVFARRRFRTHIGLQEA